MTFYRSTLRKEPEHHLSHRVSVDETVQFPADAKRGTNKRNYDSK